MCFIQKRKKKELDSKRGPRLGSGSASESCQVWGREPSHQHLGTLRISHMGEEHSKVTDLGRIFNNTMLHLGSNNNNNSSNKEVRG